MMLQFIDTSWRSGARGSPSLHLLTSRGISLIVSVEQLFRCKVVSLLLEFLDLGLLLADQRLEKFLYATFYESSY